MDKRPEAEIQFGAALNVAEPLEFELDEMVMKVMDSDCPPDITRKVVTARHHIFEIRRRLTSCFERITTGGSPFLKFVADLQDGHTTMREASEHTKALLECVQMANTLFDRLWANGPSPKVSETWQCIIQRAGELPSCITAADRSLTVAGLTLT